MVQPTVFLVGTCDTKLRELLVLYKHLRELNVSPILVDMGRTITDNGLIDISLPWQIDTKPAPVEEVTRKLTALFERRASEFHCALAIGGSGGTSVAAAAMRRGLPVGFPKLLLSTMAAGDVSAYVGESDVTMMYSVVDLAGANPLLEAVLRNAAAAAAGMAHVRLKSILEPSEPSDDDGGGGVNGKKKKKCVAISMFGVTTPACDTARKYFEAHGCDVYIFHATGAGGRSLERLVREGRIDGVLDLTTTELADEHLGGILSAGPDRLTAAGKARIPQVVSVGALDMVNFGAPETVPEKYRGRKLYRHNSAITLMRTTPDECRMLGKILAEKITRSSAANAAAREIHLPLRGVSLLSTEGGPFYDPEADRALFEGLKVTLHGSGVKIVEADTHINDRGFAEAAAKRLLELMEEMSLAVPSTT